MFRYEGNCVVILGQPLEFTIHNGKRYVAVRTLCDAIGLEVPTEVKRLRGLEWADVVSLPLSVCQGMWRGPHLEVGSIPMWCAGIDSDGLPPAVQQKVDRFQCECADVIASSPRLKELAKQLLGLK